MALGPDYDEANAPLGAPPLVSQSELLQSKIGELNEEMMSQHQRIQADGENSGLAAEKVRGQRIEQSSSTSPEKQTLGDTVEMNAKPTRVNAELEAKIQSFLSHPPVPPVALPSDSTIQSIADLHDSNISFRFQTVSQLNEVLATHKSLSEVSHSIDELRQQILESELNHQLELAMMGQKASTLEREIFELLKSERDACAETDRLTAELRRVWPENHEVHEIVSSELKSFENGISTGEPIIPENLPKKNPLDASIDKTH